MARFGRVLSAMVTPFDDNGDIDLDTAKVLARYLQDRGNDGLVIAGTTGEAPTLNDDERLALFAAVIEAVTIPVIAAPVPTTPPFGPPDQQANGTGAAGIAVCPYYNRPSKAGLSTATCARFRGGQDLPVVVYASRFAAGQDQHGNAVEAVREVPNIVRGKMQQPTPARLRRDQSLPAGRGYSGDDVMTLPLLASGIVGTIGVATHGTGRTTARCSTCGTRATSRVPASSTAACWRALRSRPARRFPTRSRPRR